MRVISRHDDERVRVVACEVETHFDGVSERDCLADLLARALDVILFVYRSALDLKEESLVMPMPGCAMPIPHGGTRSLRSATPAGK